MAQMYPKDIGNYKTTKSERYFYNELQKQLSDKYHVFYSVRWFEIRDGKRVDSESDFIVYDPSFGYITIEVKGGIRIEREGKNWTLVERDDNGEFSYRRLNCSPYEQAEKSMRHFHDYFVEEFNQSFNGAYGFAVAFPWYKADDVLSSDSPKELTIDLNNIGDLAHTINSIFHYWKNKRNLQIPFSAEQRKRFISLINKRISLSAAAGALIPIQQKQFEQINCIQDSLLDAVYNYKEIRFVGGAGTGKTYIGAKKAIRDAIDGKRVLFTCCSKQLVEYVRCELLKDHLDNITCLNFDDLMKSLLREKYVQIIEQGGEYLNDISELPEGVRFDSIIVDEAQDYDVDMGLTMRSLLKKNFSSFYVFFDENQNVFSKDFENSFAIDYPPVILRYNIRNTGSIYQNAIDKTNLGRETLANTLLGVAPEYYSYSSKPQAIKATTNVINRLTGKECVPSSSIVILSNLPFEQSILGGEDHVGAFVIDKSENYGIIDDGSIRFSTTKGYKGMESDVVIFLNHQKPASGSPTVEACEQYVALTRARYYLYVLNVSN